MINSDKRYGIFARDFFQCNRCGKTGHENLTLAHKIKSGKGSEKYIINFVESVYHISISRKQASDILDDELNLVTACRGSCNDSFNIFFDPMESVELIKKILVKNHYIK